MTSRLANYPEEYSQGALQWMQVAMSMTNFLADAWFEEYEKKKVKDTFTQEEIAYDKGTEVVLNTTLVAGNGYDLIPEFASTLKERIFETVPFQSSELGKSILSSLEKLEVKYLFESRLLINDEQFIDIPAEVSTRINSFWSSYFSNAFTQSAEILRDQDGKEYCYWYSSVLYGSRARGNFDRMQFLADIDDPSSVYERKLSEEEVDRKVIDFGQWSTKMNIPWISKCLFYLGETPFPSSPMNMGRALAYSGLTDGKLPIPYMRFAEHEQMLVHGLKENKLGQLEPLMLPVVAPQQIQMGWLFEQSDFESHKTLLTTITTALIKITSYLEDGYFNHGNQEGTWPFHVVLFSDFQLELDVANSGNCGGYSQWLPSTVVFELTDETKSRYEALHSPFRSNSSKREDLNWIVMSGIGKPYVGSATNDLLFSHLLEDEEWFAIDWYARQLWNLEVPRESTTAISNLGISKYLQGDFQEAIKLFHFALERSDKSAEDEASFYLSLIYKMQGDLVKSSEYAKRSQAAGGYEPKYLRPDAQ